MGKECLGTDTTSTSKSKTFLFGNIQVLWIHISSLAIQLEKRVIDGYIIGKIPHFVLSLRLRNVRNPQHYEQMLQFKGTQTFITLSRDAIPGLHNNYIY